MCCDKEKVFWQHSLVFTRYVVTNIKTFVKRKFNSEVIDTFE